MLSATEEVGDSQADLRAPSGSQHSSEFPGEDGYLSESGLIDCSQLLQRWGSSKPTRVIIQQVAGKRAAARQLRNARLQQAAVAPAGAAAAAAGQTATASKKGDKHRSTPRLGIAQHMFSTRGGRLLMTAQQQQQQQGKGPACGPPQQAAEPAGQGSGAEIDGSTEPRFGSQVVVLSQLKLAQLNMSQLNTSQPNLSQLIPSQLNLTLNPGEMDWLVGPDSQQGPSQAHGAGRADMAAEPVLPLASQPAPPPAGTQQEQPLVAGHLQPVIEGGPEPDGEAAAGSQGHGGWSVPAAAAPASKTNVQLATPAMEDAAMAVVAHTSVGVQPRHALEGQQSGHTSVGVQAGRTCVGTQQGQQNGGGRQHAWPLQPHDQLPPSLLLALAVAAAEHREAEGGSSSAMQGLQPVEDMVGAMTKEEALVLMQEVGAAFMEDRARFEGEVARLVAQLGAQQDLAAAAQQQVEQQQQLARQIEQLSNAAIDSCSPLRPESFMEQLYGLLRQLEGAREALQGEQSQVAAKLAAAAQQAAEAEQQRAVERREAEAQMQKLRSEASSLRAQLHAAKAELVAADELPEISVLAELPQLEAELASSRETTNRVLKESGRLRDALRLEEAKVEKQVKDLQQLKSHAAALARERDSLQQQLKAAQEAQAQQASGGMAVAECQRKLESTRLELEATQEQCGVLQQQLGAVRTVCAQLREQLLAAQQECEQLQQQLQQQLAAVQHVQREGEEQQQQQADAAGCQAVAEVAAHQADVQVEAGAGLEAAIDQLEHAAASQLAACRQQLEAAQRQIAQLQQQLTVVNARQGLWDEALRQHSTAVRHLKAVTVQTELKRVEAKRQMEALEQERSRLATELKMTKKLVDVDVLEFMYRWQEVEKERDELKRELERLEGLRQTVLQHFPEQPVAVGEHGGRSSAEVERAVSLRLAEQSEQHEREYAELQQEVEQVKRQVVELQATNKQLMQKQLAAQQAQHKLQAKLVKRRKQAAEALRRAEAAEAAAAAAVVKAAAAEEKAANARAKAAAAVAAAAAAAEPQSTPVAARVAAAAAAEDQAAVTPAPHAVPAADQGLGSQGAAGLQQPPRRIGPWEMLYAEAEAHKLRQQLADEQRWLQREQERQSRLAAADVSHAGQALGHQAQQVRGDKKAGKRGKKRKH